MEDPQLFEMIRYVLIKRVGQLFDSGGESMRSMRSHLLEAVLHTMPEAVREHPKYNDYKPLLAENPYRFKCLAMEILKMAKCHADGVPVFPETAKDRMETLRLGQLALADLDAWAKEIRAGG